MSPSDETAAARAVKRFAKWCAFACLAAVTAFALAFAVSWWLIDWDESGSDDFPGGVVLLDSAGEVMRVTLGPGDTDCRPTYCADEEDWIVKAVVAVEDGEFWAHCGVRPLSIARAFMQNAFSGRRISGASTLTMQTVRLIHPHPKSYARKWVEAFEAMKMERRRDKKWILSQYLNRAPFGANFVGIEAAAQGWFGKDAKALGLGEAALLAAMVQAPSRYRPDRGADAAFRRRDYVLARMLALGMIDSAQAEAAAAIRPVVRRARRPFRHPYYCDWFLKERREIHGADGFSPVELATPLEPDVQELCEAVVNDAAASGGYSVAAVVLRLAPSREPRPVVALACSGDYFDKSGGQVNTAVAPRPAGSTLKPFLTALALDLGIVTPSQRLNDAPIARKGYRPANFDAAYRGPVTVRDALVLSLNIPFVQLLERVGLERFGAHLRSLGFSAMAAPDDKFGLGMAIGNVEVSLVELVRAYAEEFAARASDGAQAAADAAATQSPSAYLVSEMLSGDERAQAALGHIADVRALPRFAWKTGTSSGYRDAWCVLWNPEFVIGVWCGHKRGGFGDKSLVGAIAAAPPAWRIARGLYPAGEGPWFRKPERVAVRRICAVSGLVATDNCAETEEGTFISGVSAPELCGVCGNQAPPRPKLAISRPEDGAEFSLVKDMKQQKIVCEAIGNGKHDALWWFLDGSPVGRSVGAAPFAIEPMAGEHSLSCADAEGNAASISFTVRE